MNIIENSLIDRKMTLVIELCELVINDEKASKEHKDIARLNRLFCMKQSNNLSIIRPEIDELNIDTLVRYSCF